MAWTEADDERVREFCKTADVGALTECPKCGMGASGSSEMVLALFCTHKYCPFREWRHAKEATEKGASNLARDAKRGGTLGAERGTPKLIDNDAGEITVSFNGKELRGWSYADDAERRTKMLAAREYVEGWCDGRDTK